MRLVFMGTPDFAATILENVAPHHQILAVYTRPDAVRTRGTKVAASSVKQAAQKLGLSVNTPKSLRDPEALRTLRAYKPEVICVAAYGALLPSEVLSIPSLGCLNVHASLLPRWRGAAPLQRSILAGDREVGVCIMRMEEGLDTGAYCVHRATHLGHKNMEELSAQLADLGSQALLTALMQLERGRVNWTEQDEARATYAAKIQPGELFLQPQDSVETTLRKIRASDAAHPARVRLAGRGVRITQACALAEDAAKTEHLSAGMFGVVHKKLAMALSDGLIQIQQLKPDGKQSMSGASFASGVQGIKSTPQNWEIARD